MSDEVDDAFTVINRALEAVTALRQDLVALQNEVKFTEQARKILEGRLSLEISERASFLQKDADTLALNRQLADPQKDS